MKITSFDSFDSSDLLSSQFFLICLLQNEEILEHNLCWIYF